MAADPPILVNKIVRLCPSLFPITTLSSSAGLTHSLWPPLSLCSWIISASSGTRFARIRSELCKLSPCSVGAEASEVYVNSRSVSRRWPRFTFTASSFEEYRRLLAIVPPSTLQMRHLNSPSAISRVTSSVVPLSGGIWPLSLSLSLWSLNLFAFVGLTTPEFRSSVDNFVCCFFRESVCPIRQ